MKKRLYREYRYRNSEGKITKVHVYTSLNGEEREYLHISGYNPFPFYGMQTKFYTSHSVFEDWMVNNGYTKITKETDCFNTVVHVFE